MNNRLAATVLPYGMPASEELGRDERAFWVGQPRGGIVFQSGDLFAIPFSIMWGGFAIFWEAIVLRFRAPLLFRLWGIPFVLIGLYMMFGRFFYDAWRRRRTWYVVTGRRVLLIADGFKGRQSTSLPLEHLTQISFRAHSDGRGTITFGPEPATFASGWPFNQRRNAPPIPTFEMIQEPRRVYDLIRDMQEKLKESTAMKGTSPRANAFMPRNAPAAS